MSAQKTVNEREIRVSTIFLQSGKSATMIIPRSMARRQGLDKPCHVTIQEADSGGILIRKLELKLDAKPKEHK